MKAVRTLTVNGQTQVVAAEPWETLLDVLREKLRLPSVGKIAPRR